MGIPRAKLHEMLLSFLGIVPRVKAFLLGNIDLRVTFGDRNNFHNEILTFQVVDFAASYHAILGRPCYAKFMVVPNYTYASS